MKRAILFLLASLLVGLNTFGLSRDIGRDIEFPKNYDPVKAAAIRKVIQDTRFKFVSGIVSYWPPDWGTRLSFDGDAQSLNDFISELRKIPGIGLRLVLYKGRNDEGRSDSPWQLDYSHARPDQVTIYLNLQSAGMDFYKLKLPEWPPIQN